MLELMRSPVVFDGGNLYNPPQMVMFGFTYFGVGRSLIDKHSALLMAVVQSNISVGIFGNGKVGSVFNTNFCQCRLYVSLRIPSIPPNLSRLPKFLFIEASINNIAGKGYVDVCSR